jgi:acyl-CoA synthetase (NDP forming)
MKPPEKDLTLVRRLNLVRAVRPQSVAIVGASNRAGSFGARSLANLSGYTGTTYLVNAKYQELNGKQCYPSIAALPEVPDCVIVALPGEAVEPVIEECARLGVGGAIIFASGYAETGKAEKIEQQKKLSRISAESGIRIFGPNCMGVVNYLNGAIQSFHDYPKTSRQTPNSIGLVSQSGALGLSLSQAIGRGVSFSHIVTFGNACDVDAADIICLLAEDPACKAIACVFEGMTNPRRLVDAARLAWERDKPLVIYKLATGEQGAQAAMSHTGSLAGSQATYRAVLENAGVILVDNLEALLEVTAFFAKAPAPVADGVAVVVASGGAAIMAADKAELHGVPLPQPASATREILERHIPDFGSARNPCDATAQVVNNPSSLEACGEAMTADPAYGAVVVAHPVAGESYTPRLELYASLAARHGKPVCAVWLSEWHEGPGASLFEANPYVATFHSMDRCFFSIAAWQRRHRLASQPKSELPGINREAATRVAAMLSQTRATTVLTERESKDLLREYGVRANRERLVMNVFDAIDAANQMGYPVVLKIESPDIPHKTEAGVVRLGVNNDAELTVAFEEIWQNALRVEPTPAVQGVLVQEMVPKGVEVIVGARIDLLFGPLVVVGLGGVLVELLKDSCMAPAPISACHAKKMLRSLKGAAIFEGFRGLPAVDLDALAEVVSRISLFAADHQTELSELDVNPLICRGADVVVVDALMMRRQAETVS